MLEEVAVGKKALMIGPGGVQMLELVGIERSCAQQRQAREIRARDEERAGQGEADRLTTDRVQCVGSPGRNVVAAGTCAAAGIERGCDTLTRRSRYFTMHHTARTPSRHPIFLPSSYVRPE